MLSMIVLQYAFVHLVLLQIPICSFSKQCISWIELTILQIKLFKGETGSEL